MIISPLRRTTLAALALLPLAAASAAAHVSLERREAPNGKSYKAVLKIPHGCDGSPTHTVRVEIPEGFVGVKPMPKPGWTLTTKRGAYAQSYGYHHGPISEGVREIEWSGGTLADEHYDEFVAAGFLARELTPGATLYFKVVQVCAKGDLKWVEVPGDGVDAHDLAAPAAALRIADGGEAAAGHGHGHGAKGGEAAAGGATVGSLAIADAWTRATAAGAKVGAGYLTIRNSGSTADALIAVETSVAGRGEIHDMTMTDGVMRMRRIPELEIPAGGAVELKPGGKHLMLMDLKEPLVEGREVVVKLTFKSGAVGEVVLPVKALGARGGDASGHGHRHHH